MYPSRFRYEAPRSLDEAIALLHDGGEDAKVLAGGQSLVPLMKLRFASPELIVDINNVPGLDYHRQDADGTLHVGALCRHATLEHSSLLSASQPTMTAAAPLIADPLVRNRGTLVGSLCHADPQGDWASVVTALGGAVIAQGPGGRRRIPISDFVSGPFENALELDEVAVEAVIPPATGTRAGGYLKLERRVGDFATVGVAVAVELTGEVVTRAGIALTGVGGATISATEAAGALAGQAAERREHRAGGRRWPRRRPSPRPITGAAPSTSGTWCIRSSNASWATSSQSRSRRPEQAGRCDMTTVYDDVSDAEPGEVPLRRIRFTINGKKKIAEVEPRLLLAHLIRRGLGLTGTHMGCDTTNCGACTVLVDGRAIKSCTMLAVQVDGHEITTVEGLATASELHPLQEGFREEHGLQCGFCTPGMMMAARQLLDENPDPSEEDIRWALSGNLCRCTGYQNIVKSVLWAAEKLRAEGG